MNKTQAAAHTAANRPATLGPPEVGVYGKPVGVEVGGREGGPDSPTPEGKVVGKGGSGPPGWASGGGVHTGPNTHMVKLIGGVNFF